MNSRASLITAGVVIAALLIVAASPGSLAGPLPVLAQDSTPAPELAQADARQIDARQLPQLPPAGSVVQTDVEVTFGPSRQVLSVGEAWSMTGEIHNRTRGQPIWIVDTKTVLVVAPEVFGDMRPQYGIYAILPTLRYDDNWENDRFVRIESGSKYPVVWRLDAVNPKDSLFSHAFFSPAAYQATVLVQYWLEQPTLTDVKPAPDSVDQKVYRWAAESDKTAIVTATRDITYDASLWVLLVGSAIGGILCYLVQRLSGRFKLPRGGQGHLHAVVSWILELCLALLLPITVTILVARLSSTDSPLALRIRDLWGAMAMGFVVQWLGIAWFSRFVPGANDVGPEGSRASQFEARTVVTNVEQPDGTSTVHTVQEREVRVRRPRRRQKPAGTDAPTIDAPPTTPTDPAVNGVLAAVPPDAPESSGAQPPP